jgi:hypothetical protein
MRTLSGLICMSWLLGASAMVANASPILWNIPTLNFPQPSAGTVSGIFTYDADVNSYSAWSIDVSGFPDSVLNALLTPSTSVVSSRSSAMFFDLFYSSDQAEFRLIFDVPLTDSAGTVPGFAVVVDAPNFTSWNATVPVAAFTSPEPMPGALVLLGGVGLLIYSRSRVRRRTSRCQANPVRCIPPS